jgi:hypothetical protein
MGLPRWNDELCFGLFLLLTRLYRFGSVVQGGEVSIEAMGCDRCSGSHASILPDGLLLV